MKLHLLISCLCVISTLHASEVEIFQKKGKRHVTQIDALPYCITESGCYQLAQSLTIQSAAYAAITINAKWVSLNLKGHILDAGGQRGIAVLQPEGWFALKSNRKDYKAEIYNGTIKHGKWAISGIFHNLDVHDITIQTDQDQLDDFSELLVEYGPFAAIHDVEIVSKNGQRKQIRI